MGDKLTAVLSLIDDANTQDPNTEARPDGSTAPAALLYGERMSASLAAFDPAPSEELQIACRAQHLERWRLPRSSYPQTKPGYHAWRTEQKKRHAERVGALMAIAGYDQTTQDRVGSLVRKENLKRDADAQALEDVACLVFLENYAVGFAADRDADQVIDILKKTLRKMSSKGHSAAFSLPLHPDLRAAIDIAVDALNS